MQDLTKIMENHNKKENLRRLEIELTDTAFMDRIVEALWDLHRKSLAFHAIELDLSWRTFTAVRRRQAHLLGKYTKRDSWSRLRLRG